MLGRLGLLREFPDEDPDEVLLDPFESSESDVSSKGLCGGALMLGSESESESDPTWTLVIMTPKGARPGAPQVPQLGGGLRPGGRIRPGGGPRTGGPWDHGVVTVAVGSHGGGLFW